MTIPAKYSPYIFIIILSLVIAIFRTMVLTDFGWYVHVLGFIGQCFLMSAIWQLISNINKRLQKRYPFEKYPAKQIMLQVLVTLVLLSPIFIVTYFLVSPYLPKYMDSRFRILLTVIMLLALMLMTFGYYTYDLFLKHKKFMEEKIALQVRAATLEKDKSILQYHQLRNQVNPHFLFNTFTSLDGLILTDPELASEFVRHLSKVYRYVLEHKENEVVNLQTEVNFIQYYISLLKFRFKDALEVDLNISPQSMDKGIVMVTLQMLIDNAIKHNKAQVDAPLKISVQDKGDHLLIRNNKQLRKLMEESTRQGLQQLKQLYSYLSQEPVIVTDAPNYFEVNLPLL
jgi:two-component system LytT family sensor kinase